jgi:hypothetical protein
MKERKYKVVVLRDGKIVIEDAAFTSGQRAEVTVRIEEPARPAYPLRGLPVRLIDPFGPAIDESEWDAER